MKRLVRIGVVVGVMAGSAVANDPPLMIARIDAAEGIYGGFATDYVCVGDQNGDGYDDLLLNHDTWRSGNRDYTFLNRIELYYGGPRMDDRPDFMIRGSNEDSIQFGGRINLLGRLTSSENPWWAVQTVQETTDFYIRYKRIYIYEAGEALDTVPEFIVETGSLNGGGLGLGRRSLPYDINGDGFNDLISVWGAPYYEDPSIDYLEIRFGGDEFDTDSDVRFVLEAGDFDISSGYDVNGDGCDDILVRYRSTDEEAYLIYSLYLGGEQFDTVATWSMPANHFEQGYMSDGFALVPDVNGDGFDDWVINYSEPSDDPNDPDPYYHNGYFLFFGGERPDADPDSILEGGHNLDNLRGEVIGGNVNGDRFGDIITGDMGGYRGSGEVQIFFGSRWMSRESAMSVNGEATYPNSYQFGTSIGGIGDYNGDEINDFVVKQVGGGFPTAPASIFVLAGNPNWEVGIKEDTPPPLPTQLSLSTYPNPFNDRLTIGYSITEASVAHLGVFDIEGGLIEYLPVNIGQGSIDWHAPSSGVYLVVLSANSGTETASKIVQKIVCLP